MITLQRVVLLFHAALKLLVPVQLLVDVRALAGGFFHRLEQLRRVEGTGREKEMVGPVTS